MTFKRDDIKNCSICERGIAHNNPVGMFWRLKLERLMLDPRAIQREAGMESMMGGGVDPRAAVVNAGQRVARQCYELADAMFAEREVSVSSPVHQMNDDSK